MNASASSATVDLAPLHRVMAKHIVAMTSLLVEQAGYGDWQQVCATRTARRVLLEHLHDEIVATRQPDCLDALFAAVEESEHTLTLIFGQPLPA